MQLLTDKTRELIETIQALQTDDAFETAQRIMPYLGAHVKDEQAQIGFWIPDIPAGVDVYLEVLSPPEGINLRQREQTLAFRRQRIELLRDGDYAWGVISGMTAGTRGKIGDFYHLVYEGNQSVADYLAYSIPFGAFAPAEFYDIQSIERTDSEHFRNLNIDPEHGIGDIPRVAPPTNILQLHVAYASPGGTLESLTELYRTIADKIRAGQTLSPAEQNYIGYDAVQLMPIEPIIEYEAGAGFWLVTDEAENSITVNLHRPDMTNWGYDVVISASSAINPVLLGSGRPDELVDFIAELHNFPNKPIKVMLDIVYGHIDNQSLPLMCPQVFAGANMYGQNLDYENPVVRALLLEMMRRKHSYGVDGIRVDGAQDFKNWDAETDTLWHDDDYLRLMNNVVLEVDGQQYLPWMIFEDGRPWPRADWEMASTYREITKQLPNVWQWGPLTFAHNTPFLFTFWVNKWWRIREMAEMGREWITGCANHDTLRRGSQVPIDARVNGYLGETLREIILKGYDNPAAKLLDYAMMPGVPMDFINASMRAPWGFIRNTDDRWGVKVVSEEARFAYWHITPDLYQQDDLFPRLKGFGFETVEQLRRFMTILDHSVQATDYDLGVMARILNTQLEVTDFTAAKLKAIARAWMNDVHEFCNVRHYWQDVQPQQADFNLQVRRFRQMRPWLMENLREDEYFTYRHPTDGAALFYGVRRAPDSGETLLFIANMEGRPVTLNPLDLPMPDATGWRVALHTPNLSITSIEQPITLKDSEGVVFLA